MQNAFEITPQIIPSEPVNLDVYIQLREFARRVAKTY